MLQTTSISNESAGLNAHLQFTIQEPEQGNRAFIRQLFTEIKTGKFTHLHISTLNHNVLYFAILLLGCSTLKISKTVHSINEYFGIYLNDFKSVTETIGKFILRKKITSYRVLVPDMVEYFKAKMAGAEVVYLPGDFFNGGHPPALNSNKLASSFTILIPGSVEKKRRDYDAAIRFLRKELDSFQAFGPIKLVLGGKCNSPEGRDVVKQLQTLEQKSFKIAFSDEEIGPLEYQQLFYEAHIVWNPITLETVNKSGRTELSGISHSPGFFTDQVRFWLLRNFTNWCSLPT